MQAQELVLRDVHVPAAPSLWPPAPGWWLVAGGVLALIAAVWLLRRLHARKRAERERLFDDACRGLAASAQVAAMSELLRRAARQVDKRADKLQGEAWLHFLDGKQGRDFSAGAGRLLLQGGYQRDVEASELATLKSLARKRFLELMMKKK